MGSEPIDYDALQRQAMEGLIREALRCAIPSMPDGHYFEIFFKTSFSGVEVPPHIRADFPNGTMIRLRSDYWDLEVDERHFEVGLSFRNERTRVRIPFAAVTRFQDPGASFSLWLGSAPAAPIEAAAPPTSPSADEGASADVVSLDAFRRRED